jgi:hypothetical protein
MHCQTCLFVSASFQNVVLNELLGGLVHFGFFVEASWENSLTRAAMSLDLIADIQLPRANQRIGSLSWA